MSKQKPSLDRLLQGLPAAAKAHPVHSWHPECCGVIDIRIDAQGCWYHDGEPIRRPALVKLFASILRRDSDGFYLVTPAEKQRIAVEDAPLWVNRLRHEGQGEQQRVLLITQTDDRVPLDDEHPLWVHNSADAPAPYVRVRDRLDARIGRNVFYQLVALAVSRQQDGEAQFGVWSCGRFFRLDADTGAGGAGG